jgi:UDP-N-acetylmuramyl pentapeptide phosphotransferase/UDP-N-acetylglucosamine-1-phosphate transferase
MMGLCIYGMVFQMHGLWFYAILAFSTVGVLVPFFYYNVFGNAKRGKKLFMGDSGSQCLGLILGFLAIRYAYYMPDLYFPLENTLLIAVSPILIPMLDVVRVMIVRAREGKSMFEADRKHIHHKLMDAGLANSISLIIILSTGLFFCVINYAMTPFLLTEVIVLIDISLWFLLNEYINYLVRKRQAVLNQMHDEHESEGIKY